MEEQKDKQIEELKEEIRLVKKGLTKQMRSLYSLSDPDAYWWEHFKELGGDEDG